MEEFYKSPIIVISTGGCSKCSISVVTAMKVMIPAGTSRWPISIGSLVMEQDGTLLHTEQAVRPEGAVYSFDMTGFISTFKLSGRHPCIL